jgi:aldose 1-epimerase
VRVRLLPLGATIRSCEVRDGRDGWVAVHLALDDLAAYRDRTRNPYLGATCGRWANRIAGSSFALDGRRVELVANEGPNQLHGGPDGFDRRVWDVVDVAHSADGGRAVLRLESRDGDQGFPGTLDVTATFTVEHDELRVSYEAVTDAPTVVNLTSHGYWNLSGASTIDEHTLQVWADDVLPVNEARVPVGGLQPVDGTPFDLRIPRPIGEVVDALPTGLDHCFAVRGTVGELRRAALLRAPSVDRWLLVHTDQPGLQVYDGAHLPPPFGAHAALALEAQRFPDAPNRPELGPAVLRPGERYTSTAVLRFGAGTPPS